MRERNHGLFGGSLMMLILMLSAASGLAGKMAEDDFLVQVCPRMLAIEIPGNMENAEWMSGEGWIWSPIPDHIPTVTDTSKWSTVLAQTDVLKFYIDPITGECDEAYRKKIAGVVRQTGRKVCVEVGGSRMNDGIKKHGDQAGEQAARHEQKKLQVWLDTPGAQLDYLSIDHAMMWFIREMTPEQMELLVQEHLDYIEAMQQWRPGLKVGFIESLGYFWFTGKNGKQYRQTDVGFPKFDFREFMTTLMEEAKKRNIEIDHFDMDFGFAGCVADSIGWGNNHLWREEKTLDFGRILEAESVCKDLGLSVGVFFNDTLWDRLYAKAGCETPEDADRECGDRSVAFIKGYFEAGGRPDRLCFQSWMTHPTKTGPETHPDSFFGVTLRQLKAVKK